MWLFALLVAGRQDWMSGRFAVSGFSPVRMGCKKASVSVGSKRLENDVDY